METAALQQLGRQTNRLIDCFDDWDGQLYDYMITLLNVLQF